MGTLALNRPLSRARLTGRGGRVVAARDGAAAPAVEARAVPDSPAQPEPAAIPDKAVEGVPAPKPRTWRVRMAADLHAVTGGETPAVFRRCLVEPGAPTLPLALGIKGALVARYPSGSKTAGKRFLSRYCVTRGYRLALAAEGAMRHDLDGRPVEAVSEAHRAFAARQAKGTAGGPAATEGNKQGGNDGAGTE